MKKVSGTLKLDLAQYRELAAFSQFASDLDAATKAQLDRGARMMELLKQGVYVPVTVEKQICSIFAGAKGYLDAIETSKVTKFELDLYTALEDEKTVLAAIKADKLISPETETKLIEVIKKIVEINK
jgi:F-type H+/Na+-transporting ATPase subunit alpha